MLITYDLMRGKAAGSYRAAVSFGEYGAPDFDSRVNTISAAAAAGIMSLETQVDELWGASKDDEWKAKEAERIRRDKGLLDAEPPMAGDELP